MARERSSQKAKLSGDGNSAKPKVSLRGVAKLVGVSTATVSRAVNHPEVVSPHLREKIEMAANQLGWVPDGMARALITRRSRTIGAVFPTLSVGDFARATNAIQAELTKAGYTLLLACSEYDIDLERQQVRKFIERGVDGLILVGQNHHPDVEVMLSSRNMPVINTFVYNEQTHGTCVGPDNRKALIAMTNYLLDIGHTTFAAIAQSTWNNDRASARLEGLRYALAERGLAVRPHHLLMGEWTIEEGRTLFRRLMATEPRPTAIVCGNAHLAVGAVLEALNMGIRVPDELSIVGYDDIEIMSHLPVPITTVRVPSAEIGSTAAKLLIARLEGLEWTSPMESVPELVIRQSSGPPPRG